MRQHNTDLDTLIITGEYSTNHYTDQFSSKPVGLWYDLNGEWLEWCEHEMPMWVRKYLFELNIDMNHILLVDTPDKLLEFFYEYKTSMDSIPDYFTINWEKVEHKPPVADPHGIRSGWYTFPVNFDPNWQQEECKSHSEVRDPNLVTQVNPLMALLTLLR